MYSEGHEGTVREIQLFYTKLATPDNHVVIIPNGTLANTSILNTSMLGERRLDILVGISYDADIRRAREVILQVLEADAAVLKEKAAESAETGEGAESAENGKTAEGAAS